MLQTKYDIYIYGQPDPEAEPVHEMPTGEFCCNMQPLDNGTFLIIPITGQVFLPPHAVRGTMPEIINAIQSHNQ